MKFWKILDHLVETLASFTVVRVVILLVKMTTYFLFCRRVVRM